ncbi:MAG TPA: Uma2 family endonuclease [Pyrinomonadaceae bacterium]
MVPIFVGVQDPILLADDSEPQPDISIIKFRDDFYKNAHPTGTDTLLVIGVADSSAEFDRSVKFPKYAAAGIPEAWLVDLPSEHIEVHSEPKESTYGVARIYQRGEEVVSEIENEIRLAADDILG